jgi:hypothetical protein
VIDFEGSVDADLIPILLVGPIGEQPEDDLLRQFLLELDFKCAYS